MDHPSNVGGSIFGALRLNATRPWMDLLTPQIDGVEIPETSMEFMVISQCFEGPEGIHDLTPKLVGGNWLPCFKFSH